MIAEHLDDAFSREHVCARQQVIRDGPERIEVGQDIERKEELLTLSRELVLES